MNKEKVKTGLIVLLIVLVGLFGVFGGKAVKKYQADIEGLKQANSALKEQKDKADAKIVIQEAENKAQKATIDSCMAVFEKKDNVIAGLNGELQDALGKLNFITSDSSYQFLQRVAYNYPGAMKFLFNELQIRYIHKDYLIARNAEKVIPEYKLQVDNCKTQFAERDKLEAGLKNVIGLQKESLTACEQASANKETIIKDTEKQRDKEKHRKGFWRFVSAVEAGGLIVLAVFGL